MTIPKKLIIAYALKNATEHDGLSNPNTVLNSLFNHGLTKSQIPTILPTIKTLVAEINALKPNEQSLLYEKHKNLITYRDEKQGLPELPNNPKKVIMRFAPSASGPMHIGHALSASLSYLYFKKYSGRFYVRIEDTNPEASYKESYKLLKEDAKWLFDNDAEIIIQSERMDNYYKYAEKIIKKDMAYICNCDPEKFKTLIQEKTSCPCRKLTTKENLQRWKKMLNSEGYKQGDAVLRFKSGTDLKNPALRDFPLARINTHPHPLQKLKYRVWPLMNLSVAVDDIEMKMTHIIRGKDHRDNAEKQKMIFNTLNKPVPWTGFLGIIHFKDLELSTSKMREAINNKDYTGWDDPKLPTLISLKNQGYKPESFWKFAEQIGLNEIDKKMTKKEFFDLLRGFDKKSG